MSVEFEFEFNYWTLLSWFGCCVHDAHNHVTRTNDKHKLCWCVLVSVLVGCALHLFRFFVFVGCALYSLAASSKFSPSQESKTHFYLTQNTTTDNSLEQQQQQQQEKYSKNKNDASSQLPLGSPPSQSSTGFIIATWSKSASYVVVVVINVLIETETETETECSDVEVDVDFTQECYA